VSMVFLGPVHVEERGDARKKEEMCELGLDGSGC